MWFISSNYLIFQRHYVPHPVKKFVHDVIDHDDHQVIHDIEDLERLNKLLENEVDSLALSEKALKKRLKEARFEVQALNEKIETLKSEKYTIEQDRKKIQKEAKKYKKKKKTLEKEKESIYRELKMCKDLQNIQRLEFERLQFTDDPENEQKNASVCSDIDSPLASRSRVDLAGSLSTFKNQTISLQNTITEKDKEIKDKNKIIRRLENKVTELGEPEAIIRALNEDLKKSKDKCHLLDEKLAIKRESEAALSDELIRYKQNLAELDDAYRENCDIISSVEEELAGLRDEMTKLANKCLEGECTYVTNTIIKREEKLREVKALKSVISETDSQVELIKDEISAMEKKLEKCSSAKKRVLIMNEIAIKHADMLDLEMDQDVNKANLLNFSLKLVDQDCLGCQYLESEINRIRTQRKEFQGKLIDVQMKLAEAEGDLRDCSCRQG